MLKRYAESAWRGICRAAKTVRAHISRRAVAVFGAVLVVGCAVMLNFFLADGESSDGKREMAVDLKNIEAADVAADDVLDVSDDGSEDYFATVSLGRQQARDEAMEVLLDVTENSDSLPEARAVAMADINRIALEIEKEGRIETMVMSRGFDKCVAVVNGESASVVVSSDALTPGEAAQISEIVYEAAGIVPTNLKIIERSLS